MTNEEKQLLLKDLCMRLPYTPTLNILGVTGYDEKLIAINRAFAHSKYTIITNSLEEEPHYPHEFDIEEVRPYLRPMSSITERERHERYKFSAFNNIGLFDWLNERHFDYRGLIEKGLALEAPEGMYNTKSE